MANISDRIKQIIDHKRMSIRAFESTIGCSNGVIARVIAKNTDLGASWLEKIAEQNPTINGDWLLTGRGKMLLEQPAIAEESATTYLAKKAIPLIPLSFAFDFVNEDGENSEIEVIDHYILPDFKARGVSFLVRFAGTSMQPNYSNGDILACRRVGENPFYQWGNVYIVNTEQGVLVKRVFEGSDSKSISLQSDNSEHYPAINVRKDSIKPIAMVVGLIRTE